MKIKTAIIISNPKKKSAGKVALQVKEFLEGRGIRAVFGKEKAGAAKPIRADLLVAISGDGTILYNKNSYDAPIFGIGSRKSFICQANERDWKGKLGRIIGGAERKGKLGKAIAGGEKIENRLMLSSELDGKRLPDALNEVVVRNRAHRILELKLWVGKKKFEFRADGVMFSTPTGSSAYAYSCGGRELKKTAREYEIVAIAPFRRAFKPMVVPENASCRLEIESECDAHAVIDGQFAFRLKRSSKVRVWKGSRGVRLFSI